MKQEQDQIENRQVMYVGDIPSTMNEGELRKKFETFGRIIKSSVHMSKKRCFGFITFQDNTSTFRAIEYGKSIPGCENLHLRFGGRRHFLDTVNLEGTKKEYDFDAELKSMMNRRAKKN